MADDNMEISYDENGDDDIDINIDIEPENQDEDFIIEDARSEAGTNNDDVMIDEDTASYPMEDADFVPEHDLHDVGTETHEVSEVEMLKSNRTDIHPFHSEVITDLGIQADERWDLDKPADDTHYSIKSVEIDRLHSEDRSNIVEEEPVSQAQSPPGLDASIQKPSSPSRTAPQQEEEPTKKSPPHMVDESNLGEEGDDAVDLSVHEVQTGYDLISQDRTIIALYKDTEYALVSSSEFDDPDSYFLKDSSVLKEPLSIFFAAIRDVLCDEISPVDELYLAIDDLGLETSENSSSNNDLTFEQIVDLHTTLVHNDGETVMPPLYVTLGARPEFAKSFGKLVEDAKQGKGLYEVVKSWSGDEELDVWADSEVYVEEASLAADVTNEDNIEEAETKAEEDGAWTESGTFEDGDQQHVSLKESIDDDLAISAGERLDAIKDADRVGPNGSLDELDISWVSGHDATTAELGENGNRHDEVDEDGDLIDYEDEDYAQAGNGILAAPKQQKNINTNESAEYEAINENLSLSRRSSTRTIENINGMEPTSQPEPTEFANGTVVEESYDEANVHAYEGDEENVLLENGDALYHVEGDANHYGEHNGQLATEEQDEQSDQVYEVHEVPADLPGELVGESLEKEDEDEIGYEEEEEKEEGKEEVSQPPKAGLVVSSGNAVMPAEESKQQRDEIDYEDDEEENPSENSELKTPAKQLATGKRPHQDETALDVDTPEAKRPRS